MNKISHTISIIILIMHLSCVQIDDFEIPKISIEESDILANTNILAVKNALNQSGEDIYTFRESDNTIIEGFVISSDAAGNFYKSLIVQDNYKNPTSGIEIMIDLKAYYTKYNFGRKVFIKMAGLSIVNNEGKYKIGYNLKNKVEEIPEPLLNNFIIRSSIVENIKANQISLSDLDNDKIGTFIQIENIQFKNDEIGKTYAGEKFDKFNGERILVQCDNQINTVLSTSSFSDFKSNIISNNSGSLSAVLTKDFFAKKFILILNDPSSINFSKEQRCDPEFYNCVLKNPNGTEPIFYENFQEIKKIADLEALGWINTNTSLGNTKFKKRTSRGNVTVQISAFNTEESPLEAWLITPSIDLDNSYNEVLSFDTKASFDNGSILTVWVSTNFSGDIKNANWQQLDVKISVGPGNSYVNDFISSGLINLDCLEGEVNIAFKYLGGDPGVSTTYDLDNVLIVGSTM
ncbi:MAG: DUF5689 domain-containing protein [Flavobacteriaceae bacterium]|nr:DUF5689 domain-containing protein [Flavobacteriaceae bacterium]